MEHQSNEGSDIIGSLSGLCGEWHGVAKEGPEPLESAGEPRLLLWVVARTNEFVFYLCGVVL